MENDTGLQTGQPKSYTMIGSFQRSSRIGKLYHLIGLVLYVIAFNYLVLENIGSTSSGEPVFDLVKLLWPGLIIPLCILWLIEVGLMGVSALILAKKHASQVTQGLGKVAQSEIWQNLKKQTVARNFGSTELRKDDELKDKNEYGGTIERGEFLIKSIAGLILIAVLSDFWSTFEYGDWLSAAALVVSIILGWAISRYLLLLPIVKRTRATGLNPWIALVLLVPPVNIAFFVFLCAAPAGAANSLRATD